MHYAKAILNLLQVRECIPLENLHCDFCLRERRPCSRSSLKACQMRRERGTRSCKFGFCGALEKSPIISEEGFFGVGEELSTEKAMFWFDTASRGSFFLIKSLRGDDERFPLLTPHILESSKVEGPSAQCGNKFFLLTDLSQYTIDLCRFRN